MLLSTVSPPDIEMLWWIISLGLVVVGAISDFCENFRVISLTPLFLILIFCGDGHCHWTLGLGTHTWSSQYCSSRVSGTINSSVFSTFNEGQRSRNKEGKQSSEINCGFIEGRDFRTQSHLLWWLFTLHGWWLFILFMLHGIYWHYFIFKFFIWFAQSQNLTC